MEFHGTGTPWAHAALAGTREELNPSLIPVLSLGWGRNPPKPPHHTPLKPPQGTWGRAGGGDSSVPFCHPLCQAVPRRGQREATSATSWVPRTWGQVQNCFRFLLEGTGGALLGFHRWEGVAEAIPKLFWDPKGGKG